MPARKKRIAISVDDDLNELLDILAKHENKPKATFVADILHSMKPHFRELIYAMELVEQKKDPSPLFRNVIFDAQQHLLDISREVK